MEEFIEDSNLIKTAYIKTKEKVNTAPLNEYEKNAINILIEKLINYYEKKLSSINRTRHNVNSEKAMELRVFMTDILVDINMVLDGGIDIYYFASVINKKLNDKEIGQLIKKKK